MAPIRNAAVIFSKVPIGYPENDKHIKYITDRTIDIDTVDTQGGIVVKNLVVSIDPYMRARMREPETKSYLPAFELNEPLTNFGVSKIVKSDNAKYKVGQLVYGLTGYEEYTIHPMGEGVGLRVLTEAELKLGLPLTTWVGAAGMTGQTAFYGFYHVGEPKKGDTIFITGASGAVGQIVGQLGGDQLEAALDAASNNARFVECGMISQYNEPNNHGIRNIMQIVIKRIKLQGFNILDKLFDPIFKKDFHSKVLKLITSGELKIKEDVTKGLEHAAEAFVGIFQGKNFGKAVIQIADE
ncbi:unnamed protein product [Rotaria sordida]|uniref:15-oxoprostaglandin 13-reductase n=1 Tax=Rotaria sordida TaxID=392033 RepID=A0A814AAQ4_9BILA|nr:unnamed protein product [Rotaria sordida]